MTDPRPGRGEAETREEPGHGGSTRVPGREDVGREAGRSNAGADPARTGRYGDAKDDPGEQTPGFTPEGRSGS